MDQLLNPNVAYLILVASLLVVMLAVLSPGTGVLELSALVLLVAAGWVIFNLPINYWALGVLVLGFIPFLLAVRRSGKIIYLIISIITFVIGSIYLFQGETWWAPGVNPFLAVIVSTLSAVFIWIATTKSLEASRARPTHDLAGLIGEIGEAKTAIQAEGSVQVSGELWSARSQTLIPEGAKVRVLSREGFILTVEAVPGSSPQTGLAQVQSASSESQDK